MGVFKSKDQEINYYQLISILLFLCILIAGWKYSELAKAYEKAEYEKNAFCKELHMY